MDLHLIAAGFSIDWAWWGNLAQGILALGLVILIHEFGHFAAAKLCGVKVIKFYIGFDPYGLRLFRFKRGETEYGIGLIPLGGYVYMLGQTDNPGKQAEEAERARAAQAEGKPVDPEAAAVWDPRSYPAQTVPERMFIISAGVIMNAVTAFIFAVLAYLMGVEYTPTQVAGTTAGGPGWEEHLRIDDDIIQIEGIGQPRFDADLRSRVALADLEKGLQFRIRREGQSDFDLTIRPRKIRPDSFPIIGVAGPQLTRLAKMRNDGLPTVEGTPARAAEPKFQQRDEFVKIDDRAIKTYGDIVAAEALSSDRPIKVTIRRNETEEGTTTSKELVIEVGPRPMRMLGMAMEIGPITAVQKGSPAAAAGFKPGDKLKSIDGEPVGDPITLAERLRRKQIAAPERSWAVVVERKTDGTAADVTLTATPRAVDWYEEPHQQIPGGPLSAPALGIAFDVPPIVAAVDAEGAAAKAGVKPGDEFTLFKTNTENSKRADGEQEKSIEVKLTDDDSRNWPMIAAVLLQQLHPNTKIELTTKDDRKLMIAPVESAEFFNPDRGFIFESPRLLRKAKDFQQALNYAWFDTRDSMTQVYRFLHAMWIGQIPTKSVGGIITIAAQASDSASNGFPQLLLFLMMLSCNLAVLNFLPFPVLDGGHMVFLIYEAIFRRPPNERFVGYLNMLGFFCLLFLMIFALKNDIFRLAGWM